mgnify:FL=1|jgi:hypothetical protein
MTGAPAFSFCVNNASNKRMYDCCTPLRGADNRYCRVKGLSNQPVKALLR